MKIIILLSTICFTVIFANDVNIVKKKQLAEKQLKLDIAKEKKYSQEQVFYTYEYYDFSSVEVNPESIDSVPELELDDLDMDSVYD